MVAVALATVLLLALFDATAQGRGSSHIGIGDAIALGSAGTHIEIWHWEVSVASGGEASAREGATLRHCASEKATALALYGKVRHRKKGAHFVERWYRNGRLFHVFHLHWTEGGTSLYRSYGFKTARPAGFRDGRWQVEWRQRGVLMGKANIRLKTSADC